MSEPRGTSPWFLRCSLKPFFLASAHAVWYTVANKLEKKWGGQGVELWDAYDIDGNQLNFDLVRGEPIPNGACHLVVDICVRHVDGSFLIMQRDDAKELFPGDWETGACGSVLKGETPLEGAQRELYEETGIRCDTLEQIGRIVSPEQQTIYIMYLCVTNAAKDAITLQAGETMDYQWLSKAELLAFMELPSFVPSVKERLRICDAL